MMGAEASAAKLMACHWGIHFACQERGSGEKGGATPSTHVCMYVCECVSGIQKSIILGRSWRSWQPKAKSSKRETPNCQSASTNCHTHTKTHTLRLALTYPCISCKPKKQWNFSTSCICVGFLPSHPPSDPCPIFVQTWSLFEFGFWN